MANRRTDAEPIQRLDGSCQNPFGDWRRVSGLVYPLGFPVNSSARIEGPLR